MYYRCDGIIGDYAVFSGVAAGAGKLATIEEGATVGAPAGMNPDGTIKEDKVDTDAILPNAISYSYYVPLTSTIPLPYNYVEAILSLTLPNVNADRKNDGEGKRG